MISSGDISQDKQTVASPNSGGFGQILPAQNGRRNVIASDPKAKRKTDGTR